METLSLPVQSNAYASAKAARNAEMVPIVYYGKDIKNLQFVVPYNEFRRVYLKGGRSTIIQLEAEGKKMPVLVQDVQLDPVTDRYIHVDVKAVNMNQTIITSIPLVFVGVAPAVKELGGILVENKDSIEVECLPKDLVHQIEVDVSGLAELHSSLCVADLKVPAGMTVLDDPEVNIATVTTQRVEEEAAPVVAPSDIPTTEQKAPEAAPAEQAKGGKDKEDKK